VRKILVEEVSEKMFAPNQSFEKVEEEMLVAWEVEEEFVLTEKKEFVEEEEALKSSFLEVLEEVPEVTIYSEDQKYLLLKKQLVLFGQPLYS
jgi:hypothetical protein